MADNSMTFSNPLMQPGGEDFLREQGETVNDKDIARLSPLCHGHTNILDHYSFTLEELVTKGHLRPLKEASEEENIA